MKYPYFFMVFRLILIGTLCIGSLLVLTSFFSFETTASLLNNLAPDGEFESFTPAYYQILSRLSGLAGFSLAVFAVSMLARWTKTRDIVNRFLLQIHNFNKSFWQDAGIFISGFLFARQSPADIAIMFGLVFAGVTARLVNLYIPFTHDEAYTYNAFASEPLWFTISDYHLPNNHVLLSVLINVLTHLFGNRLWLIRLPTMIAGVLMIPATYWLAKRLYSRETAMISAALVAVFPILIEYAVLARGYVIISLITLFILVLGDYVRENKNRFVWLLLILLSALGFFTIPIMLFPFGALHLWLFLSCMAGDLRGYQSKFDFIKYWLAYGFASACLTILLYMPILINNFNQFFLNKIIAPLDWDIFAGNLWFRTSSTWRDWTSSIPDWIIMLGVAGLIVGLISHKKISKQKIPFQISFFIWIVAVIIARRPDVEARMWLFLVAPLIIWSTAGLIESLRILPNVFGKNWHLAQIFTGVILLLIFLLTISTLPSIAGRWKEKNSIERAALYLKDHLRDDDLVTASVGYLPQLGYYFTVYDIPLKYIRRSGSFQRAFIVVANERGDTLESVAPSYGSNIPVINVDTAKIVQQYEDLIIYESYPSR